MSEDYFLKGTKALEKGNLTKAISYLKRAGEFKEILLNLGTAYKQSGEIHKAIATYKKCIDAPFVDGSFGTYAAIHNNLGLCYYAIGDDMSALAAYSAALDIDPSNTNAIWNYSCTLLRQWCSGGPLNDDTWKMYVYRFKTNKAVYVGNLNRWDQKSHVPRLIVLAEQGFGDKIMWGRYFSLLGSYCDHLEIQMPSVMSGLFPSYNLVQDLGTATHYVTLASLAGVFGNRKDLGAYLPKYPKIPLEGFNIYCEWAGSPSHANDSFRSCSVHHFLSLPGTKWNARPGAVVPRGIRHVNSDDWGTTAALVASMDLVITVDTSIAHLAGSLGIECWMIQPILETDFRWGEPSSKLSYGMGVEDNIWYDSVRVIDNKSWDVTFSKLFKRLEDVQRSKQPLG